MKKRKKKTGSRRGVQWVTLCISTAMVLVLLGIIVFSVQTSRNLSAWVKENLTVTVMLGDDVSVNEAKRLCRDLYHRPYARNIDYVSKEQALEEQTLAMGSDPSEFLGANPFVATLELGRMNIILLVLAALLTFVSFSLINNTVRLSVYSRRFLIHTMKLVGASWGFIRKPFIRQAIVAGVIAAVLAIIVLGGCVYALYTFEPNILNIITWRELTITAVAVMLFGVIITLICSWISVNKFLKMTAGDLYRI